jgi:hypothetical protein
MQRIMPYRIWGCILTVQLFVALSYAGSRQNPTPLSIQINPTSENMVVDDVRPFAVYGTYADGSTSILNTGVEWTSDNDVVTILKDLTATGTIRVTAAKVGATTITAKYGTLQVVAKINVDMKPASVNSSQGKIVGPAWIVYDAKDPGHLWVCSKAVSTTATPDCAYWDPDSTHFFSSGTIVRLRVLGIKFRSTFSVAVNGFTVADNLPSVRGTSSPAGGGGQPQAARTAPDVSPTEDLEPPSPEQVNRMPQVVMLFEKVKATVVVLESFEGLQGSSTPKEAACAVRSESPGPGALNLISYAQTLSGDAALCYKKFALPSFKDETSFNNLTDRTDQLRDNYLSLKSAVPQSAQLTQLVTNMRSDWTAYDNAVTDFVANNQNIEQDDKSYLPGGDHYDTLKSRVSDLGKSPAIDKRIEQDFALLEGQIYRTFVLVNSLYQRSERDTPYEIPINQYTTNFVAAIQVVENPGFAAYKFPLSAATQQQANQQQASGQQQGKQQQAGNQKPVNNPQQQCCTQQKDSAPPSPSQSSALPSSKPVYTGNFEVHKFYRANIVSGFFVSTLNTRQYGITNNGTTATFVSVVGPSYPPQYHYFVGLNYYVFGKRDLFPGALKPRDYWKPGLLLGYGLDSPNNYLLGANWEFRWGINLGAGLHIGQETFLAPGIQPGLTTLPATTISPPTVTRTRYGAYGSIGFDLATMKAALGQLFGGGSTTPSK